MKVATQVVILERSCSKLPCIKVFKLKPGFEYLARLGCIASSASSFGAALALDYLTGIFLA